MSLLKIAEENDTVIRLVPSFVPTAAMVVCVVFGVVFSAASIALIRTPVQMVILLITGCAFFLTALLVRSQKRMYEINIAEQSLYVIGRQSADMYAIPFGEIACLRIVRKNPLVNNRARAGYKGVKGTKHSAKPEYYLDILRRDTGFETLDRSVTVEEITSLATMLANRTGFGITDEVGLEMERAATATYAQEPVPIPQTPPPGSVIRQRRERNAVSFVWTLSPGLIVLILMGVVGVGLLGIGALGILEFFKEDGSHWVAVAASLIAGVLAYQVSWRFLHGVLCNGYVFMNSEGLHVGTYCLDNGREYLIIPLADIATIRVVAPRYRRCKLEVLTRDGDVHLLASLNPGLFPLTVGDLHWMNASLSDALHSGRLV